jgi:hypothetical protein
MTASEEPQADPVIDLIGRTIARYFTDVTGRTLHTNCRWTRYLVLRTIALPSYFRSNRRISEPRCGQAGWSLLLWGGRAVDIHCLASRNVDRQLASGSEIPVDLYLADAASRPWSVFTKATAPTWNIGPANASKLWGP